MYTYTFSNVLVDFINLKTGNIMYVTINDDGSYDFSTTHVKIVADTLDIRPSSNFEKPFKLTGRGGSYMLLTEKEMVQLFGEFLRMTTMGAFEVTSKSVGYLYSVCRVEPPK